MRLSTKRLRTGKRFLRKPLRGMQIKLTCPRMGIGYKRDEDRAAAESRAGRFFRSFLRIPDTMGDDQLDSGLVRLARSMVCQSNPTVFNLSRLLCDRRSFPYFLLGYAYFRWLDDRIDAPGALGEDIRAIAANQKALLIALYNGRDTNAAPRIAAEEMLAQMVRYDCMNGCRLRSFVMDMFGALEFDASRRYQVRSQRKLDAYSHALGRSYTDVLQAFAGMGGVGGTDSLAGVAGYAAHQVHILRDLYVDLSLGYCNISSEDLTRYQWTVQSLPHDDLRPWVDATARKAQAAFKRGLQGIALIRSPRCRLLGYATSAHYMIVLERLALNGYDVASMLPISKAAEGRSFAWSLRATFYSPTAASRIEALDRSLSAYHS